MFICKEVKSINATEEINHYPTACHTKVYKQKDLEHIVENPKKTEVGFVILTSNVSGLKAEAVKTRNHDKSYTQ